MLDSLVRVSRRVNESYFVTIPYFIALKEFGQRQTSQNFVLTDRTHQQTNSKAFLDPRQIHCSLLQRSGQRPTTAAQTQRNDLPTVTRAALQNRPITDRKYSTAAD